MGKIVRPDLAVSSIIAVIFIVPIMALSAVNHRHSNDLRVSAERRNRIESLNKLKAARKARIERLNKLEVERKAKIEILNRLEAERKAKIERLNKLKAERLAKEKVQLFAMRMTRKKALKPKVIVLEARPVRSSRGGRRAVGGGMSGKASWYSFSRNHGMFAAMRGYRGKRVRVSGPGGSAIVTINDYGPAKWTGRIIDLSAEAFKAVVGPTSRGVGYVRVEILY